VTDQRQNILGPVGRFFFSPTDPTALGFIRLMAGLVLLYTHAAYTPDLKEFLGPDAWWDQQAGNKQRRESPSINSPFGWRAGEPTLKVIDDVPHRRAAEIEFMRSLPQDPSERKVKLRYLERVVALTPPPKDPYDTINFQRAALAYSGALNLVDSAVRLTDGQKSQVRVLLDTDMPDEKQLPIRLPDWFKAQSRADRIYLWDALMVFGDALPQHEEKLEYVLQWLKTYPLLYRTQLVQFFLGELKIDGKDRSLPAGKLEREEFLGYLDTWGIDPRQNDEEGTSTFSYWYHLTDPTTMYVVHALYLVVCVLFAIGLWTRVTSVLAWVGSLSYIHRGQLTLFGQDTMQTILLMYLMIGPSGAALSLDALRARYRAARAKLTSGGRTVLWAEAILLGPSKSWLANLVIRLFQINFCLIYASSGLSKLKGTTWWEHSAPWLIFANPEFGLIRYPPYEWMLRQVMEYRMLVALFFGFVTLYTLFLELGFSFLVWTRLRPFAVILSTLLHFGIAVFMGLAVFGMYMFAMVLCYFPAKLIRDRVCITPGSGRKMTLRFNSHDPAAVRTAARIVALDLAGQVTLVNEPRKGAAGLVDPDGKEHVGKDLTRTALRELAILRPLRFLAKLV
jgi:uncharacterized membrane protein YphA (DoxX/SURF4 family)